MESLTYRLLKRAEIRRQISTRKSVQEGKPDRIADLLEEAAAEITRLQTKSEIEQLNELNNLIEQYHNRDGTYNYHYEKCDFLKWDVYLKQDLSAEQWAALDTEDWLVHIIWHDNSYSCDSYTVPLKEILEWKNKREKAENIAAVILA